MILGQDIDFTHLAWKSVTQDGRAFILKLLKKNPEERPKPEELLKDPWFEAFKGVTIE